MIYKTKGTCSKEIHINVEDDIIKDIEIIGGCNGNAKGIASLVKGMNIYDVISNTEGIDCGGRGTSCPDQLAKALKSIIATQ